ncbi:MAG: hypothetical protein ACSHXK_15765 [Oceanococcus sp.]
MNINKIINNCTKIISQLIFSVFTLLVISWAVHAQPAVLSAAASSKVLSDFIDDARASAEQIILSGEVVADRQVRNAANQILMVTRELEIALGDQLDKTVGDLDNTVKAALGQVEGLQMALEGGTSDLTQAFDDLSLDVAEIVGNTIFSKYAFVLKRIEGVSHLYQKSNDYVVELVGSGFGSASVDLSKVVLNSVDFTDNVVVNSTAQHRVSILFNPEKFNEFFDLNDDPALQQIKTVPLALSLTRSTDAPWWRVWNRDDEQETVDHKVYLYLIPPVAGQVDLSFLGEAFEWTDTGVLEFGHTSLGNHCQGDCDTDDRGDWSISQHGAPTQEQRCVTQRRGNPLRVNDEYLHLPRHLGGPGFNPTEVRLVESEHCLFFRVLSRTHSHAYTVQANRRTYLKLPDPVELGVEAQIVSFGETYRVTQPENTISTLYSFDPLGPVLKQTGELNMNVNNNALRVVSNEVIGNKRVTTFVVKYPDLN